MLSLPFLFIYLALFSVLTHLKPVLSQVLTFYIAKIITRFKSPPKTSYFEIIEPLVKFADQSHYIGRWSIATLSEENQPVISLENISLTSLDNRRIHKFPWTLVSKKRDIVLMDGEYLFNTKFVSIELDIDDEAEERRWDNKLTKAENKIIKYKVGDKLNDIDTLIAQECTTEKLIISLMDAETYEELDSRQDEKHNIIIGIYIIGGECPFDFLTIFTPDSQDRYRLSIQFVCCIWLIANMILRKWLRPEGPANKIQIVQAYLLSFIDHVAILALFILKKDVVSDNIRMLSLMIIFSVYTFFPAQPDKTSAAVTSVVLLALQWFFAIQYNPTGITLISIAIPLLEFVYNFKVEHRIKYNKFFYLGTLVPLLIITFWSLHQKRVFYLMPEPHLRMLWIVFCWIAFVLLSLQEVIVNNVSKQVREKYLVSIANINLEDSCPICLDNLTHLNFNYKGFWKAVYERWTQRYQRRIIKTNCGHIFHEDCLIKWLGIKLECGLCRAPIFYLI